MVLSLSAVAATLLLIAIALVLSWRCTRPGRAAPELAITPIASEAGPAVRIELANAGTATMRDPGVALRPAPPGIPAGRVLDVVPPAVERTPLPFRTLKPGAAAAIDLPCPLQPGDVYRRVLGLAPDAPADAVYGLPIETLLAIEVDWHEPRRWRRRRRHRLVLVRGGRPGGAGRRAA